MTRREEIEQQAMKGISDCAKKLVESLSQEEFAEQWSKFDIDKAYNKILEEKALKQYEVPTGSIKIWDLPDGYIFKDENGNIINATKIVLEKKKKEYPKTYEECCKVLNLPVRDLDILDNMLDTTEIIYTKNLDRLLNSFRKLLICRDAYWKKAGEEMELGKPWKPNWDKCTGEKYCILRHDAVSNSEYNNKILAFPTKEMRNAFYENFKELIKSCKELL